MNERNTNRRKAFVAHYLRCWNATEAARKSGYNGDDATLAVQGSYLLRNDKIKAAIQKRLDKMQMTADEVVARIIAQATADLSPFIRTKDSAGLDCKAYVDVPGLIAAGKGHLIKELGYTKAGDVIVKTHDQQKALELLGKVHAIFKDRTEITGKDGAPLYKSFVDVDPEKV